MKNVKSVIIGCIYAVILLISSVIAFILVPEWNTKMILGAVFLFIPYTTFFVTLIMTSMQSANRVMQNQALVVIASVYFIAELIVSVIFAILPFYLPVFLIGQLLVLMVALVAMLIGCWAKAHIEK